MGVLIRWPRRWRRGCWCYAMPTRGGARPASSTSWAARVLSRCRVARVCIGRWCATGASTRRSGVGGAATTSGGSGAPMELWQMDVVGGVHLCDGAEVKVITGIDDNSRFVVCATVVARASARPVCAALLGALARHGVPEQVLTDNGKVFTGRFGPGGSSSEVLFDRVCVENGIRHLLTAPRSPTTTGKVERLHKTMRAEFFTDADRVHASIAELQAALDGGVHLYNTERPHQSLGMRPPAERFALAAAS